MTRGELVSALWLRGFVCWLVGVVACGVVFAIWSVGAGSPVAALLLGPFLGFGATWWMVPLLAALSAACPRPFARRPYAVASAIAMEGGLFCGSLLGSLGLRFALAFGAAGLAYAWWSYADPLDRPA